MRAIRYSPLSYEFQRQKGLFGITLGCDSVHCTSKIPDVILPFSSNMIAQFL